MASPLFSGTDRADILSLLDHKLGQAEEQLRRELNAQLFGRTPERNPLRQAIADAYDQVVFNESLTRTMSAYKTQITEMIFTESPILGALKQQERKMTDSVCIATAAVAKRKEKRARSRVEVVGDYFDANRWKDGDTISWSVNFKGNADKRYHYVAIKGGANWFITGDANRYDEDGLITKLVALSLDGRVKISGWDSPL